MHVDCHAGADLEDATSATDGSRPYRKTKHPAGGIEHMRWGRFGDASGRVETADPSTVVRVALDCANHVEGIEGARSTHRAGEAWD